MEESLYKNYRSTLQHSEQRRKICSDKTRLDGIRGVRYGTEVPTDMQNGELFVKVVTAE